MKRLLLIFLLLSSNLWAGRDFDGANDEISFGSDASIDNFASRTYAFWARIDTTGANKCLITKGATTSEFAIATNADLLRYASDWTTDGSWIGTATISDATFKHICIRYNNDATTNDPTFRINGDGDALTTDTNPTGSWTADAGNDLQIGETNNDALDLDGVLGWVAYDNTIWTNAECNRARFWGRPKGGLQVYQPLITTKLTNEGAATADGTATGTTVVSSPVPVQRPSSALLNGGVGW